MYINPRATILRVSQRGFSLAECEPALAPGPELHGSLVAHQIERVIAATGTGSKHVVAMLSSPSQPALPTGVAPPTLFGEAAAWLKKKQAKSSTAVSTGKQPPPPLLGMASRRSQNSASSLGVSALGSSAFSVDVLLEGLSPSATTPNNTKRTFPQPSA